MNEESSEERRLPETEPRLPRAAVEKIICDALPSTLVCSKDVKQVLIDSCVEFVHIVATEANEICEREQRKTVTHEHVYQALESLGYHSYVEECQGAYREHTEQAKMRPSKMDKFKESGLTRDELERQQEELFRSARMALNNAPQEEGRQ